MTAEIPSPRPETGAKQSWWKHPGIPLLVAALTGGLAGGVVNVWNSTRLLRIQNFQLYDREFVADDDLKAILHKIEDQPDEVLEQRELYRICNFFEELGVLVDRNLIDYDLVKEIMGVNVIDAYCDKRVNLFVEAKTRSDTANYSHFSVLAHRIWTEREGSSRPMCQ